MAKLLICDFDNTLFNFDDYENNIKKINEFVNQGNIFIIATGRHINKLLMDINDYNIKYSYLICNDGGIIFDQNLKIIYRKDIPPNITKKIIKMYKKDLCITDWYIDAGTFITKKTKYLANGIIGKITDQEQALDLLTKITNKFNNVHGYVSQRWINITQKSVTKLKAIEIINEQLKIKKEKIYTIGDNVNDISMSIYNSYCMINSIPELKKICLGEYETVAQLIDDITNNNK
ncbi:MAG: HAD family hydrolase [Bacilli bacterium]|jgi:hypothetical protein|nr:HAD family hydrolase [Bacilli bacterium]